MTQTLNKKKITDRVKTFEDALAIVGCSEDMKNLLDYNGQDKEMIAAQAYAKLSIIRAALNEGWEPDYTNSAQAKWYPWFKYVAGSGFSFGVYRYAYQGSGVGARLTFKSKELAMYAGEQFIDIYRDYLTL